MTETASLVIKVDSRGAKSATSDLDKLTQAGGKSERAANALGVAWGKAIGAIVSGYAMQRAVRSFIQMADASANMAARLRLATKSQEEFNVAHRQTFQIAQRTSTELGSVVDLYAKLSQSTGQLGVSQSDLLRLTESITQTFQISGATAQEAAGGLRQLSQAMAGGVLRAEEFNSIIESSPRLVKALADGMGIEFGKVRQYVNEGKISSEQLVQALLSQSDAIQSEFDQMPLTVGRAMQEVRNALTGLVGSADEASGATGDLAEAIRRVAEALSDPKVKEGFTAMVSGIADVTAEVVRGAGLIANYIKQWKELAALRRGGSPDDASMDGLNARLADINSQRRAVMEGRPTSADGFGVADRDAVLARLDAEREAIMREIRDRIREEALAAAFEGTPAEIDFTRGAPMPEKAGSATADLKEKTKARKELTAAEKEWLEWEKELLAHEEFANAARMEYTNAQLSARNDAEDAIERERRSVDELIATMEFELALYGKTAVEQETMIALRHAGANATDEQREAIRRLIKEQGQAREAQGWVDETTNSARSLFATIATDSDRASDAINRFFDNLKQRLAEKTFDALLAGISGMAGGGGWGGFAQGFIGAWGGGRAAGGPVMSGQSYIVGEHGPEMFTPGAHGAITPAGAAVAQQGPRVTVNVHNAPAGTEVQQSTGADGGLQLDVILKAVEGQVAGSVAGGGQVARAIEGRYNMRPAV